MFEEILKTVSFLQEESGALFPPLCKNTDLPYGECDCEECRPTPDAQDGTSRLLTGRNGKPTNVQADGTVLESPRL